MRTLSIATVPRYLGTQYSSTRGSIISSLDSANYGQIRNLLNLVGIFVILPYPFEMFWYAGFVISSQHLQQQQMPLESTDVNVVSPAKFSMPVRVVLFF